jgi:translation initiation factor 3 subunit H
MSTTDEFYFDEETLETVPIKQVQMDALCLLKILKHYQDSFPNVASGQLIGLDERGTLEVTNSFPVPVQKESEDEDTALSFREQMFSNLKSMNYEDQSVGLYQSITDGSVISSISLMELQYDYQKEYSQSIHLIIHAPRHSNDSVALTALRLTDKFMNFFEQKVFTSKTLRESEIGVEDIFEQVPVVIQNYPLLEAMYQHVSINSELLFKDILASSALENPSPAVSEKHSEKYFEKQMESLIELVDFQGQENWKWQHWFRQYSKEYQKCIAHSQKLQQENQKNLEEHKKLLYSEQDLIPNSPQLARLSQNEPGRLETLVFLNQMNTYRKQMEELAAPVSVLNE